MEPGLSVLLTANLSQWLLFSLKFIFIILIKMYISLSPFLVLYLFPIPSLSISSLLSMCD